ncbi:TetR/AcrR family transcriptional regulator [Pseudocolwellia agarivorans]|uniref:TetR/AcrR family transcriptional regulator n=1 Tax=Pseudocolwellia agarivorans TaxID=1911682 RepID=UPI000984E68B|nr:TetR/AcrR family transcriptional regulator [Pseudocolwellia agarivorans]
MTDKKAVDGSIRKKNKAIILNAAKNEFVEHGFQGASIKRIAERANIPRANIHYYFEDKTDIYSQLLDSILDIWNTHYDTLNAQDDPKTALTAYIRSKVMYSKEDPDASKIFASEIIHGAPVLNSYLSGVFKTWVQEKVEVIESWITSKQIDPINPYHLLFLIWGATQHYADFNVQVAAAMDKTEISSQDFDEVVDSLTAIILKGVGISA